MQDRNLSPTAPLVRSTWDSSATRAFVGAAVLSDEVATARADVSYARFIDCPMPLTSLTAENQGVGRSFANQRKHQRGCT